MPPATVFPPSIATETLKARLDTPERLGWHLDRLVAIDERLAPVRARAGEVGLRITDPGFAGMARIICGQQLSVASAGAIWGRLSALEGALSAATYLGIEEAALRTAGLSAGKVRSIRLVAEAVASGELDLAEVESLPVEQAIAALTRLKGIGPWTAEIYLLFCAAHPDIFPAGDLALKKAVAHAFGLPKDPSTAELYAMTAAWAAASGRCGVAALALLRQAQGTRRDRPMKLSGPMLPPRSGGAPKQAVILLHGYGSDGQDLISLGSHWRPLLPGALFLSPNAPAVSRDMPSGFQWFAVDHDRPDFRFAGASAGRAAVVEFLDDLWAQTGLTAADTVLAGFSQGAMMALHVGLSLPKPLMGIIGFSGAFIPPAGFAESTGPFPPVLLVHGDADGVVDVRFSREAETALRAKGIAVELHIDPGVGHGIAPAGLEVAGRFLSRVAQ